LPDTSVRTVVVDGQDCVCALETHSWAWSSETAAASATVAVGLGQRVDRLDARPAEPVDVRLAQAVDAFESLTVGVPVMAVAVPGRADVFRQLLLRGLGDCLDRVGRVLGDIDDGRPAPGFASRTTGETERTSERTRDVRAAK